MPREGNEGMPRLNRKETIEKRPRINIEDFPLLKDLLEGKEGYFEYEVERRYLPRRLLTSEELSAYATREIEQSYIRATDANGNKLSFRLRRTHKDDAEGTLLRIAHKMKTAHPRGRNEYQVNFPPEDPRASVFEALWKMHDWHVVHKTRYYIPYELPDGRQCEIHYDVHHGEGIEGFVRIEIEYKNDEDENFAERASQDYTFPDWIGEDVTNDSAFGGKEIAKKGPPQKVVEFQKNLSGAR